MSSVWPEGICGAVTCSYSVRTGGAAVVGGAVVVGACVVAPAVVGAAPVVVGAADVVEARLVDSGVSTDADSPLQAGRSTSVNMAPVIAVVGRRIGALT